MKSIIAFIEANKANFFGRWESDFNECNTSFEITFVNEEKIKFPTFMSNLHCNLASTKKTFKI